MDSPEISENKPEITVHRAFLRSFFAAVSSLSIFLLLLFSVLYVAVFIGNLSVWSPISVHSRCRIVSSSVDLRSSKVEYIDHTGQVRFALAEAPNEALPYSCRPSFGAAWLTKDKFKVNGTYECWYTLGISKVNINHKGLFDCSAEYPSTVEMIKRYYILFSRILKSGIFSLESINRWRWDVVVGAITGFITAFLSITLVGLLRPLISFLRGLVASRILIPYPKSTVLLKRVCFFVAYFSFMSWVTIQYVKRLGLS